MATYYVNATDGDDEKDGQSEANAWKTISKVNSSMGSFSAGDSILFKRGETFTDAGLWISCSGSSGNEITFGAYGSGNLPIIQPASGASITLGEGKSYIIIEYIKVQNTAGTSAGMALNRGDITQNTYITVRNCEFSGTGGVGIHVQGVDHYTIDNCSFSNCQSGKNGIYIDGSNANPASNGTISNNTLNPNGICLHQSGDYDIGSNHTISGNTVTGCTEEGIDLASGSNITVTGNEIYNNSSSEITVVHGVSDVIIEKNYIHDANSNGIYIDNCSNITLRYNIIYDPVLRCVNIGPSTSVTTVYLYNNTLVSSTSSTRSVITIGQYLDGLTAKNNIIMNTETSYNLVEYGTGATPTNTNSDFDYNQYYRGDNDPDQNLWYGGTFSNWQNTENQDANGAFGDPLFVDASNGNFSLQDSSLCIDAGIDVSLTSDYNGSLVPMGNGTPDIGAVEYARFDSSVLTLTISLPTPTISATVGVLGTGVDMNMDIRL